MFTLRQWARDHENASEHRRTNEHEAERGTHDMAVLRVQTYETVDAGTYPARVVNVTMDEEGQFGPQVKVEFELTDEEAEGKTLVGWASAKVSPKSKLYKWASALLFRGKGIPEGYGALDTDTLKGQECILVVAVEKKSDGAEYNKITDVLPIRPARAAARPAPAPAPAPTNAAGPVPVNGNTLGYAGADEPPAWVPDDEDLPF